MNKHPVYCIFLIQYNFFIIISTLFYIILQQPTFGNVTVTISENLFSISNSNLKPYLQLLPVTLFTAVACRRASTCRISNPLV